MGRKLNRLKKNKNKKGFLLVEMLVSIFVFVLVILISVTVFAAINKTRKDLRSKQQNIEIAGAAISLMAKSIRMNVSAKMLSSGHQIVFYNSQSGECTSYVFNTSSNKLQWASVSPTTTGTPPEPVPESCVNGGVTYSGYQDLVAIGLQDVNFSVVQSSDTAIGRATINIKLNNIWLQDTVSFRDYSKM